MKENVRLLGGQWQTRYVSSSSPTVVVVSYVYQLLEHQTDNYTIVTMVQREKNLTGVPTLSFSMVTLSKECFWH